SLVAGGTYSADYSAPGSDSTAAHSVLREAFASSGGRPKINVVAHAGTSFTAGEPAAQLLALATEIAAVPHVESVGEPLLSADRRTASVAVSLRVETSMDMPVADTQRILAISRAASRDGLTVAAGGGAVSLTEPAPIGSEGIGLAAAAVILLITFGTVVAAGLPLLIAITGLVVASFLTVVLASVLPVPDWSTSLVAMMVIGIGIDYVLLMVTRFREWRLHGLSVEDATVATLDTAGRAVALAGTTVIVSMLGLFGMGLSYMRGASLATIVGAVVVLIAALTLLPALLGSWGGKIDRLRLPLPRRQPSRAGAGWLRWSRLVERHRYVAAGVGIVVMLVLASPFLGVQFGTPDEGNNPTGSSTRTAYDMTAAGFGAGANGPLLVVLRQPTQAVTSSLMTALATTSGVASVQPAVRSQDGAATLFTLVPSTGPQDARTAELVRRLRDDVLPAAVIGTQVAAHVGGTTAAQIDADANVVKRIPVLVAAVVSLSMLLLLVAFRSVAIAVKAAVLNLLSVAAAYGVVALALQGGWLGQLIGIDGRTPLPSFVPVLMFAVLFALSADYEIFLVSRMRDGYKRHGETGAAVVAGLASTARVITAAAAVMITVFCAFVTSPDIAVKVIGIGMAAAIFIDATIVRMLLVPAVMHILGDRNWWLPAWLDRRLPQLAVEGHEERFLLATAVPQQSTAEAPPTARVRVRLVVAAGRTARISAAVEASRARRAPELGMAEPRTTYFGAGR
ncbi:MAG: hypothetical protein JWP11_1723, partial [Frankiales bacterium]|nr:hypothetical protein [Frankiales bacterium]